jgi:amino acid permease
MPRHILHPINLFDGCNVQCDPTRGRARNKNRIEIKQSLTLLRLSSRARTIGDIGRESLGRLGHAAVELCVVLSQMGFCTMYLIFISQNMSIYLSGISVKEIVVLTLPILVLLCWIGSLKLLAPTSVLALSLLFFGLYYVLQEAAPNLQDATTIKVSPPPFSHLLSPLPQANCPMFCQ